MSSPDARKTALVTGVGRLAGIGAGIARRLAADGWDLVLTYWQDYDARMPWGVQPDDVERLTAELQATGAAVVALPADFQDPQAVNRLMSAAAAEAGTLQ
jgi:3-oxoacyl-[acyl-carrier protein] reductase